MTAGTTFLEDVNLMFHEAADLISIEEGLTNKICVCNAGYVTRFGVRLRGKMHRFG